MQSRSEVKDSFILLVLASVLTVILWFIPFAGVITHPITLFVTYIHEIGHAVMALATSGRVNRITLDWNGNGLTEAMGGLGLLISSAGYLSTTLYGAGLLLGLRRPAFARFASLGTGALLLLMTVLFAGNSVAWIMGLLIGASFLALGLKGKLKVTHFLMSFLAVQCLFNAAFDLFTLMYLSAFNPGIRTDAQNMANATGGFIPSIVWAVGWSILSVGVLIATLVIYYRSLRARSVVGEAPDPMLISDSTTKSAHPSL